MNTKASKYTKPWTPWEKQNPSWVGNSHSSDHEIHRLFWARSFGRVFTLVPYLESGESSPQPNALYNYNLIYGKMSRFFSFCRPTSASYNIQSEGFLCLNFDDNSLTFPTNIWYDFRLRNHSTCHAHLIPIDWFNN